MGSGRSDSLHGITTMGEDQIMVEPKIQWPYQQHRQNGGHGFLIKMGAICQIWAQRHGISRRARFFSSASRNWLAMAPRRRPPKAVRMANDTLAMNAIIDEVMGAAADSVTPSTTPTSRSSQGGLEVNSAGVRDQVAQPEPDVLNSAGVSGLEGDHQDAQSDGPGSLRSSQSAAESGYHEPEADVAEEAPEGVDAAEEAPDGVWMQEGDQGYQQVAMEVGPDVDGDQHVAMEVGEEAKPFMHTRAKARPKTWAAPVSASTAPTTFSRTLPSLRIGRLMRRHILADNEEPPPWWSGDATRTVPRAAPYRPPPSPMSSRRRDHLIGEARAQALYWCDRVFDLEG